MHRSFDPLSHTCLLNGQRNVCRPFNTFQNLCPVSVAKVHCYRLCSTIYAASSRPLNQPSAKFVTKNRNRSGTRPFDDHSNWVRTKGASNFPFVEVTE